MASRVALFLIILAVLFAGHRGTFSSQNSGDRSGVIDGDTLQLDGDVVQLYGIDAPELGQLCESNGRLWHCGMEAALALSKLVTLNRSSLRCSPWSKAGTDVPAPAPASAPQVCEVGGEDLAVLMLSTGNSLALPGAFPDYVEAEQQARDAGLGIWHSDFVVPWEWRAGVQSPNRRSDSSRECNVKGVFGVDGRQLYFVPTDAEYRALTIDPEQGEKMLCSDDEARSAGWRRMGETAGADE
jgi:endonuclease YncB( thermonuclease family)